MSPAAARNRSRQHANCGPIAVVDRLVDFPRIYLRYVGTYCVWPVANAALCLDLGFEIAFLFAAHGSTHQLENRFCG